jgi:hypothetical protein
MSSVQRPAAQSPKVIARAAAGRLSTIATAAIHTLVIAYCFVRMNFSFSLGADAIVSSLPWGIAGHKQIRPGGLILG